MEGVLVGSASGLQHTSDEQEMSSFYGGAPDLQPPSIIYSCTKPVGSFDRCSSTCLCSEGEGDCDSDADCVAGLVCMRDTGGLYGFDPELDTCMVPCDPAALGTPDYCSPSCPCDAGEADCGSNSDCTPGNVCVQNVGDHYGYDPSVDVCVDACDPILNGTWDYCSPDCPCESGQGDCDRDEDCVPGAVCVDDVGADYGHRWDMDMCVSVLPATSELVAGALHTCAIQDGGVVRCWGYNYYGQLGYGHTSNIGDDELLEFAGSIDVGGSVQAVAANFGHTCALMSTGAVRCWGRNYNGELGYGHTSNIGDNETPASAGDVDVGGTVTQLAVGGEHTCALLDTGKIRCWGRNDHGQLGYGHTNRIGDNEAPSAAGDVNIGGAAVQIAAGYYHTCALLDTGKVRCWGYNTYGQLGYGHTNRIGDNETPSAAGDINVGGVVVDIVLGYHHTCARLDTGAVRCWGYNYHGQLGYGHKSHIGDNEAPFTAGDVNIGGVAAQLSAGFYNTCARLDGGAVRCWGYGNNGALGHGNTSSIGDNETPAVAGDIDVGGQVVQIVNGAHTCALLSSGRLRCWGHNYWGQCGYGHQNNIGDDETPASVGNVPLM